MTSVTIISNAADLIKRIDDFKRRIGEESHDVFREIGKKWVINLRKQLDANETPGGFRKADGQPTGKRTGDLGKSLVFRVKGPKRKLDGKTLEVSSVMPGRKSYAAKQEFGGVIRAKRAKYLTIPLEDAYRANPRPNASQFPGTFVAKVGQKLFIVRPSGAGRRGGSSGNNVFQFLFVLKKSVKLEKRLGGIEMMEKTITQNQTIEFSKAVSRAGAKAFGRLSS